MIEAKAKVIDETAKVLAAEQKAAFNNLLHATQSLSKDAKASIEKSSEPSPPNRPPHTRGRGGHNLKGAIRYDVDKNKQSAISGPIYSFVGTAGEAHEFGGSYKGQDFDERPFMGPALERAAPRFAGRFSGSIGQ